MRKNYKLLFYDCHIMSLSHNDKKVEDSSAGKNHGEIIGKAQWVDGKLGKALELDVKVLE